MPTSKPSTRDKSHFSANVTASLRIMHKNIAQTGNSMLYSAASIAATTTQDYIVKPLWGYMRQRFFNSAAPKEQATVLTKKEAASIEHDLLKKRQTEAEQDSVTLNAELEALETKISELFKEKKEIDNKENTLKTDNKEKGTKKTLSETDSLRRLKILESIDDLLVKKLERIPGLVQEHATRRVDLMFLLMIAVYKQNVVITKGQTNRQHGRGSTKTGTAACHASLIPHPEFKTIANEESQSKWSALIGHSIYSLFANTQIDDASNNAALDCQDSDFLKGSYFEDVLNVTTELPIIVNDFDGHMEGKWEKSNAVKASLQVLNQVSKGILDPIQGLNQFGTIMSMFFSHMQYKYVLPDITYKPNAAVLYPKAFAKVWQYEQEGTLPMFTIETQVPTKDSHDRHVKATVKPQYFQLMLNLQGSDRVSSYVFSGAIEKKILEIQKEILSSKSEFATKLKL